MQILGEIMKKHLFAAAATLAVIAGSAANADDWTGFYVGGAVSSVDTAISWTGFPFDYTGSDSAVLGVFAGYNH